MKIKKEEVELSNLPRHLEMKQEIEQKNSDCIRTEIHMARKR